jgi:hypothetical protein
MRIIIRHRFGNLLALLEITQKRLKVYQYS